MQKGLQQAVNDVLPFGEHRLCARHVYANWSKQLRGNELKKKFFSCAWSTYKEQFNDNLKALEKVHKAAAERAVSYPVKGWAPPSSNPRSRRKKRPLESSQHDSSSAILPSTPAASTQQTSTPSESGNQSTGRKRSYRAVKPFGFGIMVDEDSGRSFYNPGLRSEKVIEEGTSPELLHIANPTTKFPIPNEKEMRKSSAATSSSQDGSRKIGFTSPSCTDSSLAVNPLGLRWKGQPSISSSQLRIQS